MGSSPAKDPIRTEQLKHGDFPRLADCLGEQVRDATTVRESPAFGKGCSLNAAVTGGTGFVGQALVRLLVKRGGAVRVLVRRPEADATIRSLGAEPVRGDLEVPGDCDGLVRPGDVVYHAAARVAAVGRWADFRRTTIEGTRPLLKAALRCRPQRFVYVSTGAVYSVKHVRGGVSADRTPVAPPRYNLYARAKLEAENLVRAECEKAGCPWTIVRLSCTVYGPGHSPLVRSFLALAERGFLYVVGDGQNQFATSYVDDVARAVLLAGVDTSTAGKIYDVASEEPVTLCEFLNTTAWALGLPRVRHRVARPVAYAAAALTELWARARGREPPFNRWLVILMSVNQVVDTGRIRRELGWQPRVSFKEGMRRMQEWYRQLQEGERGTVDGDRSSLQPAHE